jgi:hypothetical protein
MLGDRKMDPKTDHNLVFADPAAFGKKMHLLWLLVVPRLGAIHIQRLDSEVGRGAQTVSLRLAAMKIDSRSKEFSSQLTS